MIKKILRLFLLSLLSLVVVIFASLGRLDAILCRPLREILMSLTSLFPYSLFEAFILLLPLVFIFLIKIVPRILSKKTVAFLLIFLLFSYLTNIAIPSWESLSMVSSSECSPEELFSAAGAVLCEVNFLSESKNFDSVQIPYGAKRSVFSQYYTFLGISALYYFPTAEYVVNTDAPHYICVFSSAHEFAHFNSVMREDQANLFAYKLLSTSDNLFFRYAAALYAYEVISSALIEMRPELYEGLWDDLCPKARADILSHEEYVRKYKDGILYKLSVKLNSKSQGIYDKRGGLSYSLSAHLLTNYILSQ